MLGEIGFQIHRQFDMFKARAKVFWLSLKYGGKKNIPPQLIFDEMDEKMSELKNSMMQAFRIDNLSEDERNDVLKIIGKINELDSELKVLK